MLSYLVDTYILFIIIEIILIGVLAFFVYRWGRDYKKWKKAQEEQRRVEEEQELEIRLIEGSRRQY